MEGQKGEVDEGEDDAHGSRLIEHESSRSVAYVVVSNGHGHWGYFNRLTKCSPVPDTVELNGSSYSTADSKAAVFSSYFSSVFNTDCALPDDLPSTPFTESSFVLSAHT